MGLGEAPPAVRTTKTEKRAAMMAKWLVEYRLAQEEISQITGAFGAVAAAAEAQPPLAAAADFMWVKRAELVQHVYDVPADAQDPMEQVLPVMRADPAWQLDAYPLHIEHNEGVRFRSLVCTNLSRAA